MHLAYSLLLLFSAVTVLVQGWDASAVSSRAIFIGKDTTTPEADGEDIFKNPRNHAAAAASILLFNAKQARFSPKDWGLEERPSTYEAFTKGANSFPGFLVFSLSGTPIELTGEVDQFKDQIATFYRQPFGNDDNDAEVSAFVDQVSNLVPGAKSGVWILSLVTIYNNEETKVVTVKLASVEVAVSVNDKGAIVIQEQETSLNQATLRIKSQFLISNAAQLARLIPTASIDDFKDELTTSTDDIRRNQLESWLLGPEHGSAIKSSPQTYWPRRQRLYSF
ncbi:hypothetical protein B0O80DRAFT_454922 [Mortierella sp. GBAus27b]|nr:hypothetical protein BGX31_003271 [Mortierella sp. GBA43]KAI8351873.1 hypothetical protein B0O80DRAFT_454922 [Mortierella sp. GBAus27b]